MEHSSQRPMHLKTLGTNHGYARDPKRNHVNRKCLRCKGTWLLWIGLFLLSDCSREPIDWICPELEEGDLRISELRGEQQDADSDQGGQWIELVNTTSRSQRLAGLRLNLRKLNGKKEVDMLVRQRSEEIDQAGFYVLGRFGQSDLPTHVNYGYADDFDASLYPDGIVELWACGVLIDRLIYRNLVELGSWSFDSDTARWCADNIPDGFGTPQQRNIRCTDVLRE